jgi:hypothetical protein
MMRSDARRPVSTCRAVQQFVRGALYVAASLLIPVVASRAESGNLETQAWGNFTIGWIRSEKLYLELDLEPQQPEMGDQNEKQDHGRRGGHSALIAASVIYSKP